MVDGARPVLLPRAPAWRTAAWSVPQPLLPDARRHFSVLAFDTAGTRVQAFVGEHPCFHLATGVREKDGRVWLGSLERAAVAVLDL